MQGFPKLRLELENRVRETRSSLRMKACRSLSIHWLPFLYGTISLPGLVSRTTISEQSMSSTKHASGISAHPCSSRRLQMKIASALEDSSPPPRCFATIVSYPISLVRIIKSLPSHAPDSCIDLVQLRGDAVGVRSVGSLSRDSPEYVSESEELFRIAQVVR